MALGNGLGSLNAASFFNAGDGVASDISRPFLFKVEMPDIGTTPEYDSNGLLSAFARTTKLPGYKLAMLPIAYAGMEYRISGVAEFEGTWDITFLLDEQHTLRQRMLLWMQRAHNANDLRISAPSNYKANTNYSDIGAGAVKVFQLTKNGETISTYNFVGAFPKEVGDIELNHDADKPSEMTVTFSYDYFTATVGDSFDAPNNNGTVNTFGGAPFSFTGFGGDPGQNG